MVRIGRFILLFGLFVLLAGCAGDRSGSGTASRGYASPLDSLNDRVKSSRGSVEALLARARYLLGEARFDEALADAFLVLQKDSNHLRAHTTLAGIYMESYQSQLALRTLERVTRLYPDSLGPILQLAEYQLILKQYDQSRESVAKVLTRDPQNADALFILGLSYMEQGEREEAIASFQSAVEINPELTDAWLILGNYMEGISVELAEQYYDNAVRIDPDNISVLHSKAFFLQNQDRFAEAIELYTRVKEIDPGYTDAYLNTGLLMLIEGRVPEAIDQMLQIVEIDSTNAMAYFYLGKCYEENREKDNALSAYRNALKWSPNMQRAREAIQAIE